MTKFQHKIYQFMLSLMDVVPLPDDQELFVETYSTCLIQWRYLLGRSLRAETTFPIDALKVLESSTYQDSQEELILILLKEIAEIQRIFFLIISEQNDGVPAFTDVVIRHWIGMIKEIAASEFSAEALDFAGETFDNLILLHKSITPDFEIDQISAYPFIKSLKEQSPDQLIQALDDFKQALVPGI